MQRNPYAHDTQMAGRGAGAHHRCGGVGPACGCGQYERLRVWNGRLLMARDVRDLQDEMIRRLDDHQRGAHGSGILSGLVVGQHPREDCRDEWVVVSAGSGYDCCGRSLVLCEDRALEVPCEEVPLEDGSSDAEAAAALEPNEASSAPVQQTASRGGTDGEPSPARDVEVGFVLVERCDVLTEPVPSLYAEDLCDPVRTEYGRVREDVQLRIVPPDSVCERCWPRRQPAGWEACLEEDEPSYAAPEDCGCPCGLLLARLMRGESGAIQIDTSLAPTLAGRRDYTHVTAYSWEHGSSTSLSDLPRDDGVPLLVVRFSAPLARDESFPGGIDPEIFVVSFRPPYGAETRIAADAQDQDSPGPILSEDGRCLSFRIPTNLAVRGDTIRGTTVTVRIHCDFLLDERGLAVSGSHIGGVAPSRQVHEGGTWLSWFRV